MRAKKDGEFLNCYIDKSTNEAFAVVAKLLGKTKTAFLEEAMQNAIAPYLSYDNDGPKLNIREAYLSEQNGAGQTTFSTKKKCYVVSEEKSHGTVYYNIVKDGQLVKVKSDVVEIVDT